MPFAIRASTRPNPHLNGPFPPSSTGHRHYYPTPSYRSSSSSSSSFKGRCRCLFLLFSFLALLILAILLLAGKPKKPQFDLQQVTIQYMGITPTPPSSSASSVVANDGSTATTAASVSLSIRLLFTAVNPNKVGIKYGESGFTIMYRGIPLGKAYVPRFYQDAHSVRQIVANIAIDRVNLK